MYINSPSDSVSECNDFKIICLFPPKTIAILVKKGKVMS